MIIEFINLWNLANISSDVYVLMFDFIALGIIAEFDDYFIEIYRNSNFWPLIDGHLILKFTNNKKPKRDLPNLRETKLDKLLCKIRTNLKEIKIYFNNVDEEK